MDNTIKKCPICAEEIKIEARVCRYCKARFDVMTKGYCAHDHQLVEADENGKCSICGGELMDTHVDSNLIEEPIQKTPTFSKSIAQSEASIKKVWAIIGTVVISLLCGFPGVLIFSLGVIFITGLLSPDVPPDMLTETLEQSGLTKQEFIYGLLISIGAGILLIMLPIVFGFATLRQKKHAADIPKISFGTTLVRIVGICVILAGLSFLTVKSAMPKMNAFLATETPILSTLTPISSATAIKLSSLRYDGLYVSVSWAGGYSNYLRFYDDGTVISVFTTGKPEEVAVWFNKAHSYSSKGQYEIHGSTLKFAVTSKEGTVDYNGVVDEEELTLDMYSHINSNKDTYVYHFIEMPGMKP